ncbi:MAG: hypothetical protein BWX86_02008 [Verrucomicrobia bacterium ADurb.Bin122]|nr:MAG: hypothetical protein BWX86_02008 [Verrucomicrobia bacterium ADurb.Bin122]
MLECSQAFAKIVFLRIRGRLCQNLFQQRHVLRCEDCRQRRTLALFLDAHEAKRLSIHAAVSPLGDVANRLQTFNLAQIAERLAGAGEQLLCDLLLYGQRAAFLFELLDRLDANVGKRPIDSLHVRCQHLIGDSLTQRRRGRCTKKRLRLASLASKQRPERRDFGEYALIRAAGHSSAHQQ